MKILNPAKRILHIILFCVLVVFINGCNNNNDENVAAIEQSGDEDGDGVSNQLENLNANDTYEDDDTDLDNIPNYLDPDDDGDGVLTIDEDVNGDGNPLNDDEDLDNIPNCLDSDDDEDGILTANEDVNQNGNFSDDDTDGDQIPDYLDHIDNSTLITQTVLFVYDTLAAQYAIRMSGTLEAHTQSLIDEANEIYENSGIIVRLAESHTEVVNMDINALVAQSSPFDFLVDYAIPDTDGVLDEIHTWRDMYDADLIVLKINGCGGFVSAIGAEEDQAFALVGHKSGDSTCTSNLYAFTHELGHLQGAAHQEAMTTNEIFPYGYAYGIEGEWSTIMYSGDGKNRIKYFSGPDVYYNGVPTGDENKHNNVKAINWTAKKVSEFR